MNKYKILKNRNVAVFLPEFSNLGFFFVGAIVIVGAFVDGFLSCRVFVGIPGRVSLDIREMWARCLLLNSGPTGLSYVFQQKI